MALSKKKIRKSSQKVGNVIHKYRIHYTEYHPVIDKITNEYQGTLKYAMDYKEQYKEAPEYRPADKYKTSCFFAVMVILNRSRQIEESIRFVKERPSKSLLKRYKMDHKEFFEYHYNILLIYYTSFSECMYQVINTTLNLGLDEKNVTYSTLLNNQWVKRAGLTAELKAIDKLRSKHASDRNIVIHQGKAPEVPQLKNYFLFEFFSDSNTLEGEIKKIIEDHKKVRRNEFKWHSKQILKPIQTDFEQLISESEKILNKLAPLFDYWIGEGKDLA